MNAVEIEEAVSALAAEPFDAGEFPYAFLRAFGNKETTIQRLRAGSSNTSEIPGGVLQRNNIHVAVCAAGNVGETLTALKASPRNAKGKVRFVLATDGVDLEAEELASGEVIACQFTDLANHFGFFLPLAGISTVAEIKNNPIDIKATSRLNKLYVELLKENEDWGKAERRQELNQFMARLIFCFFAEDTGIFTSTGMFSACLKQMTDASSANTHEVIKELFRAMDTRPEEREAKKIKPWANVFPYVNGGLFTHKVDAPRFSKIARSYLLRAAELNWKEINPDIFGSMIQAVAEDDERGELGMHYTSVPNILKVLEPLFLDDLRRQLDDAADNPRKLLNLRKRLANIRVFDPACGSGNFLVIAYIEMRRIEAEIIRRRKDEDKKSWIKLTSFYGIEIKSFAAEIARLSLLIAEFQCNVRHIGQREACLDVLPLHDTGHIATGNALRLDWFKVCPPPPASASVVEEDLAGPTGRLALDAPVAEVETYICGNPPYLGSRMQSEEHKEDLKPIAAHKIKKWRSLDYVAGWLLLGRQYLKTPNSTFAFVCTSSMSEGLQVPVLWPHIIDGECEIVFAQRSFRWTNLATNNAAVSVVVVGVGSRGKTPEKCIFDGDNRMACANISPYLLRGETVFVHSRPKPTTQVSPMVMGAMPRDGGNLILSMEEAEELITETPAAEGLVRRYLGSEELIQGKVRCCLWVEDDRREEAEGVPALSERFDRVRDFRWQSPLESTRDFSDRPHRFVYVAGEAKKCTIAVAGVSSESRPYLPVGVLDAQSIASNLLFALYDAPLWNMALIASRLHLVWIATVCGKMKTDFRYSNTLGWNTFPVPPLTESQKRDLTRCAEDILLAREAHFPATIADLYDPENMPANLRAAHDANDETLERIYIGRRFRNDTERLEKLFEMYTKMTRDGQAAPANGGRRSEARHRRSK
jgi:hypothetical protein